MSRRGLFLALDRVSRAAGYTDDSELGPGVLIAGVLFACLFVSSLMYPYFGVIVP